VSSNGAVKYRGVTPEHELAARLRYYYTRYYRDTLGIPDWAAHVAHREREDDFERARLQRLRELAGDALTQGPVLNIGCGTGGFNVAAARAGACVVGVDADADAIAICELKRRVRGGQYVRAVAEALPFRDGTFALVHCFSVIEHVDSIERTVAEMVRVTRPGGALYVHTPNAWSLFEGHYKLFWIPFLPTPLARLYLKARGRPTEYLAHLRRLTVRQLVTAFRHAGVTALELASGDPPRESVGPLRMLAAGYYRLTRVTPFIELVARKG
jgi:2-polyprenyl-3-methyl-5-hydroxy-6-metoxy-1,4-benzoquinol methylase